RAGHTNRPLRLHERPDGVCERDNASGFWAASGTGSQADARGAEAADYAVSGFVFRGGNDSAHVVAQRTRRFSVEKNIVNVDQTERLSVVGENGESIDSGFLARFQNFFWRAIRSKRQGFFEGDHDIAYFDGGEIDDVMNHRPFGGAERAAFLALDGD